MTCTVGTVKEPAHEAGGDADGDRDGGPVSQMERL
jgi:hypothetical protein